VRGGVDNRGSGGRDGSTNGRLAVGVGLDLLSELGSSSTSTVGSLSGVTLSLTAGLGKLRVDNVAVLVDLSINGLLVVQVEVRAGEGNDGGKKGQAPEGKILDKEITDEGGSKGTTGSEDVLDIDDALEFNDNKVQEIVKLLKDRLDVLAGNGVVAARTHARDQSTVSKGLASSLKSSHSSKEDIGRLEDVTHNVNETESQDGGHEASKDEEGGTRVLPSDQVIEEAVEMGEGLV